MYIIMKFCIYVDYKQNVPKNVVCNIIFKPGLTKYFDGGKI
jgi:hypothetical protein